MLSDADHESVANRHGSTTVKVNEFNPVNVETSTPFKVNGLTVMV